MRADDRRVGFGDVLSLDYVCAVVVCVCICVCTVFVE
jgi:hypothetical protein